MCEKRELAASTAIWIRTKKNKGIIAVKLLLCFLVLTWLGGLTAREIDLIKLGENDDFGRMLSPYRDGWLWHTPEHGTPPSQVRLPLVPVNENSLYQLRWAVLPMQFLRVSVYAVFYDDEGNSSPLHHVVRFENSAAFWEIEKEIVVPGKAESMELVIATDGRELKRKQNIGFMTELKLRKLGALEKNPELKDYYGKELLPISDFSQFDVGEKDLRALHVMPFGQKPFDAEVVATDDGKALKVHWRPGDYSYIAWFTPELPLYRSAVTLRCRLRGKGRVQMMAWWNRPAFPTVFKHYGFFDLTPEWKDYEVTVGCDDPLTQKAAFSIAFRDVETTVEIAEISLVVPEL